MYKDESVEALEEPRECLGRFAYDDLIGDGDRQRRQDVPRRYQKGESVPIGAEGCIDLQYLIGDKPTGMGDEGGVGEEELRCFCSFFSLNSALILLLLVFGLAMPALFLKDVEEAQKLPGASPLPPSRCY